MENLLEETIEFLKENGKTTEDVLWCGQAELSKYGESVLGDMSFKDFEILANKKYDSGYGIPEVNEKLIIVGSDWWLERHQYDGSEWWEYKTMPRKPKKGVVPVFN